MPNLLEAFRGAAGGAAAGFGFGGPVGAAIGGGLGLGLGLLTESPEQERQRRKAALLKSIADYRRKTLEEGVGRINQLTTGQMAQVRAGAARRALSLGREGEAEAFITPAVSDVAEAGSETLRRFVTETGRFYDAQALAAEQEFAGRPIEPSVTDVIEQLGIAGLQYKGAQERIEAFKQLYGTRTPTSFEDIGTSEARISGQARAGIQGIGGYAPVTIDEMPTVAPVMTGRTGTSVLGPLFPEGYSWLKPRKPTGRVDAYRYLVGR